MNILSRLKSKGTSALARLSKSPGVPRDGLSDRSIHEIQVIEESGQFDFDGYEGAADAAQAGLSAISHYVQRGEQLGLAPSSSFQPLFYASANPDVAESGTNLFVHYIEFGRAEGRLALPPADGPPASVAPPAVVIPARARADDPLFDAAFYRMQVAESVSDDQLFEHYLEIGEAQGLQPSREFDPAYYLLRYPDVERAGVSPFVHFRNHGRAEGRMPKSPFSDVTIDMSAFDATRPTFVVLAHEASRTGAPILGLNIVETMRKTWNANVFVVTRGGGNIEGAFRNAANQLILFPKDYRPEELDGFLLGKRMLASMNIVAVIANSVETRGIGVGLKIAGIPLVALVHEFSSYTKPRGSLRTLYEIADEVVFPAQLVRDSSLEDYPLLAARSHRVLPQGASKVPATGPNEKGIQKMDGRARLEKVLGTRQDRHLLVVGLGFVDWRKGCDLFVAAAARLKAREPALDFRFVWFGGGFGPADHIDISLYLEEQIKRSGVESCVSFQMPVADLEGIYDAADVLFMSSRLDPLPNVAIDAAIRGLPIVCFENGSGIAEILSRSEVTRPLVVPYLDVDAAAECFSRLVHDDAWRRALSAEIASVAQSLFDMSAYVHALMDIGHALEGRAANTAVEVKRIKSYLMTQPSMVDAVDEFAVVKHVIASLNIDPSKMPIPGYYDRKLLPGFNPYRYAEEAERTGWVHGRSPLAHYIETGLPSGPWRLPLIELSAAPAPAIAEVPLRIALHIHFFYEDLLDDLMVYLRGLPADVHLIISSDDIDKNEVISRRLSVLPNPCSVHVYTNLGRDVRPFLKVLHSYGQSFDVIGHLHGKKSLAHDADGRLGRTWRNFLWESLLGLKGGAARTILTAFQRDPQLGLVFPDDPHLIGWEENADIARALLDRMGLEATPLPHAIDFPVGTMFWARTAALRALAALDLKDWEYPAEPVPKDGTVLHATERILPLIVTAAHYHCASTYSPKLTR